MVKLKIIKNILNYLKHRSKLISLICFYAVFSFFELNANSTKTYELYEYNSAIKPTQQILALEKILNIDVNKIVEKKYKLEKNNYVQLKNCNDLLHFYRNNDPKLALLFAKLLEPQLKQFSSHPSIANFTTKVANIYHDIGKYHLAIDYYSKSLYVFIDLKDYPAACNSYNDIGYIFSKLKIRDFALKNYFLGVNTVLKSNPKDINFNKKEYYFSLAHSYSNISYEYFDLNKIDSAIYYGKKSKKLFLESKNINRVAQLNNYLVEFYLGKKDFKSAEKLLNENFMMLDTNLVEDTRYLGHTYRIKSKYMIEIGNLTEALNNIDTAISILNQIELHREIDKCYNIKANLLVNLGRINEALEIGKFAYNISKKRDSFTENLNNTGLLAKLFQNLNAYDSSIYYYQLNKSLNDSLFNIYKLDIINKFNVENELKNQELKVALISKKNEINSLWLKVLGFGMIIILIFFIIIYLQFQNKTKINKQLKKVVNELENTNLKLKNSENNLIEINRTKDRFFGIIAHDLKSPISSFHTATGLLVDEFENLSNEEKLEFLQLIRNNAKRLSNLLNSLLQLAKSQLGQIIPNSSNIDVYHITEEAFQILLPLANKKNIKLINQVDKTHFIYVDIGMIGTTFNNLINNSIKFSYPYNEIIVRSFEVIENKINYIAIEIEDFGVGIEKERLKNILSIEFNNSTPGTQNEEGSGLGLMLTKEFVEKNNGKIKIKSQFEIGTIITLYLPKSSN